MKSIHSIFILGLLCANAPILAQAQDSSMDLAGYCQDAQTTADIVKCTNTRLQDENEKLARLFGSVTAEYEDAVVKKQFIDNQTRWLEFRDETCALETKPYEGGSLARVQELACLGRVTSERSKHFEILLNEREPGNVPAYSNPPRWVNVLGADYKGVFWGMASKQHVDADCDGVNEVLLHGIKPIENGQYQNIWAIADSEKTGRPKVSLLKFDDTHNCQILPDIKMTLVPSGKPVDATNPDNQCREHLSLQTENCGAFTITYDNATQSYRLENNQ